jgi:spore coat polysaccharide biosynthesis protein SpsF
MNQGIEKLDAAVLIQARMESKRLRGKTLLDLAGQRMLFHVVARLSDSPATGPLIVATSAQPTDDFIQSWCDASGVRCFRGSEKDVLDRFWRCAEPLDVKYVVRATADNPLVWEGAIAYLGRFLLEQGCGYVAFTHFMPIGLGIEIFTKESLGRAHAEATLPHQREHVTSYIYENREKFDCLYISPPQELEGKFRLTVDTKEDFELFKEIYRRLYKPGEIIPSVKVIELLKKDHKLAAMNIHIRQKGRKEHE